MGTDLVAIAASIAEQHQLALECAAKAYAAEDAAMLHARRAGELLLQAKASMRHGEWLPWLEANVHFTERTAQRYMKAAAPTPVLKYDSLSDLKQPGKSAAIKPVAPKKGSARHRRLRELQAHQHMDELKAHALYLCAELPALSRLRTSDVQALQDLRSQIDAVLLTAKAA